MARRRLEALACGTPVVATAVGGIPEQVRDGETGFLVTPGDPEAMAKAIMALLTNEALRKRLGGNAAMDARRRFELQFQVKTYLDWYCLIVKHLNAQSSTQQLINLQRGVYALPSFE